jgi:hypothetical protein
MILISREPALDYLVQNDIASQDLAVRYETASMIDVIEIE